MIKILSWNIQQGGGSRVLKIINALKKERAHIVVLTEYRNNDKGISIRHKLLQLGYRYQAVTQSQREDNSVAVLASVSFNSNVLSDIDPKYNGNLLVCHFSAFRLFGGYFPHKKRHLLFDYIIEELRDKPIPSVICGDLNTGKNHLDQKGDSFWYQDQFVTLTQDLGLDAFRLMNGEALEYSWYSHQKNGYRYDHTIVTHELKSLVKNCYYRHQYREEKVSDHAPMILELG